MSEKLIKGTLNIFATVEYCSCGKEVLKSFVLTEDGNVVCSSCLARDWDYMVARIRELEKALEFYAEKDNYFYTTGKIEHCRVLEDRGKIACDVLRGER